MCHSTVNKMYMDNQSRISNPQNWAVPRSEVKDQSTSVTLLKEGWSLFSGHLKGPGERGEPCLVGSRALGLRVNGQNTEKEKLRPRSNTHKEDY